MPHRIGNINNIEKFDYDFFNIPVTDAHTMDPAARLLLEHTYEAIIDAGVNPKKLRGTSIGVFTAICVTDTENYLTYSKPHIAGQPLLGCNKAVMANRISCWLGVTGPSYNIDTACSSSHFAMNEAYRQIRSGRCDAAIVAGANLCLHPHTHFGFYTLATLEELPE
ncbi:PREDICTED: fatty acid synthase-like isoform X2 [Wasmannia auropunctata]|uniref:fatty acid synthase-like isoform X2 n=1 Tax=Wasmannia auropunctata TaxID=64793 RepID=UPI0005EEA1D1|nr:PREDICTED: fatty acid synthase-like isoform X2 [Wasmannia auropunctata]